ncbi:FG-GAP repeat domain-containing protein, partial [Micromonospora sp. MS34]|uniref:FG-GAP repeat domain-containing protein n=1 Tax=Micromonospora sp. MS34 TaxID=3385971 RepID=UPI00399F0964
TFTSGTFNLNTVDGRLVVADFNGDGKAEPALVRDNGNATMSIYRWLSTGSTFTRTTDYVGTGSFALSNVGDRVAAGDVTGDGKADIVMAYQLSDGTFGYYVWSTGLTSLGRWYTSG